MSLFQYFPNNYVWNLSINIAMIMGAEIGEIDEMCRPLLDVASRGDDEGTRQFLEAWTAMADKLARQAGEDEARGRNLSAARKLRRAAIYYMIAERMQGHGAPGRKETYQNLLDCFSRSIALSGENCERVEIPYGDKTLAGYFVRARGIDGPAPVLVHVNGLDSCKEMIHFPSFGPLGLAERGISSLSLDQPGTGEAIRLQGMKHVYDSERWASKVVDWLETRTDVDKDRIGMWGISLGGYFCPRAVAFEQRFALGCVFGANHDWYEINLRRLRREGDRPVPHYWDHCRWVWGGDTIEEFMEIAKDVRLDGVLDRIKVPFLVTHGANDRQIPLEFAHKTHDALTSSPKRELKIFDAETGSTEHAGADSQSYGADYIYDWVAETFAEMKR